MTTIQYVIETTEDEFYFNTRDEARREMQNLPQGKLVKIKHSETGRTEETIIQWGPPED